jgi:hypothetical protein
LVNFHSNGVAICGGLLVVDGKLQTATVELIKPQLEGTVLTYQAKVLEGTPPAAGGTTSVFIDASCLWNPSIRNHQ